MSIQTLSKTREKDPALRIASASIIRGSIASSSLTAVLVLPYDSSFASNVEEIGDWMPEYATFGEVQSGWNTYPDFIGLSDSRLLQRGFLPLTGSDNRTALRLYEGSAMVLSSRVACMRPVMKAIFAPYDNGHDYIEGVLDLYGTVYNATGGAESIPCTPDGCQSEAFLCHLPYRSPLDHRHQRHSRTSSFCRLNRVNGTNEQWNSEYYLMSPSTPAWKPGSYVYLVFTTNMENSSSLSESQILDNSTPLQEWNSYELPGGYTTNVSLCFSTFVTKNQTVRMSTSNVTLEPVVNWSFANWEWDTSDVRRQLGVDGLRWSPQERGIFDMEILNNTEDPITPTQDDGQLGYTDSEFYDLLTGVFLVGNTEAATNQTYCTCRGCDCNSAHNIHTENAMIWEDIIDSTGRAADALQSYETVVASKLWDTFAKSLRQPEEVKIATTKSVQTPGPCSIHGCAGFISVTALLIAHWLCVTVVTVLYTRQVRYSRYGNIWHTLSQLISPEMNDIIEQGNDCSDKAINTSLKREAKDDFVKLHRSEDTERIEVTQHSPDDREPSEAGRSRLAKFKGAFTWREKIARVTAEKGAKQNNIMSKM